MNQKLYMQVIIQAIRDSASSDDKKVYKAFDWFGSVDFEEICLQANLNPQHLRESLLKLINSKDRKIAGKQFPPDGLFLLNIEYDSKYNLNYEPCFPLVIE